MKLYDDKWIVITGGAGFIGSGVIRYLNDQGMSNIIVVDDLGQGEKWKNLVGKRYADIVSRHKLFDWLKGRESDIEAFIHMGACSDTVTRDADYLLDNNFRFSVRLAQYALQHEHRFIYASSAATYGNGSQGFQDDINNLDALRPLNMYGYSKHMFDLWLKAQDAFKDVVGLKFFNVFGPNEYHKGRMASAVLWMVPQIRETGTVRLFKSNEPRKFGDGDQVRDFIYVKDVVALICGFLKNDAAGLFNMGSGRRVSWNQLARAVFSALKVPPRIEYIDMPKDLTGQYQNDTCADMAKLKSVGLPAPTRTLEDAVTEYVRDYVLIEGRW